MTDRHAHLPLSTGAPGGDPFSMEPFVFATAQYASGDWDSAPMLPANVIDSVARDTAPPVRPQGVSVPLSADAVSAPPLIHICSRPRT